MAFHWGQPLPIQGSPFRDLYSTVGFHRDDGGHHSQRKEVLSILLPGGAQTHYHWDTFSLPANTHNHQGSDQNLLGKTKLHPSDTLVATSAMAPSAPSSGISISFHQQKISFSQRCLVVHHDVSHLKLTAWEIALYSLTA